MVGGICFLIVFQFFHACASITSELNKCFQWPLVTDLYNPNCSVQILASTTLHLPQINCLDNATAQIIGNFSQILFECSSNQALDFHYDGFQPTESISIRYAKDILPNSNRKHIKFRIFVGVSSKARIEAKYGNKRERAMPLTGRFTVSGVFDSGYKSSVYLFIEEPDSLPRFIRNNFTRTMQTQDDGMILVPCRTSHAFIPVNLKSRTVSISRKFKSSDSDYPFDPREGFIMPKHEVEETPFVNCSFEPMETVKLDTISFKTDDPGSTVPFGFEGLKQSVGDEVAIFPQVDKVDGNSFTVNFNCRVNKAPGSMLLVIHADNPGSSRLVQEFVLPTFANMSLSVGYGTATSPPGTINFANATLSGLVFCQDSEVYKLQEYATGFDRIVRSFPYATNWSEFDVTGSPARNHLLISPGDGVEEFANHIYYIDQTYTFRCWVRTHGLAPPVVWYQRLQNGSLIEELIDQTLVNDYSHFRLRIQADTTGILVAASFWDRDLWKNVTYELNARQGHSPEISSSETETTVKAGSKGDILSCKTSGDPLPRIEWLRSGKVLSHVKAAGELSLVFQSLSTDNSGTYTCKVSNIFGEDSKSFVLTVTDDNWMIWLLAIPVFVLLSALGGSGIYFKYIRKESAGLTEKDIKEFKEGLQEAEKNASFENEFVPENALAAPYSLGLELSTSEFQISNSEVLGSGAYGIVFRGIVKGVPCAIKTCKQNAEKMHVKALLMEIKIMAYLGPHDNVVNLIGANTSDLRKGKAYLFVELCGNGSLEKFLRSNRDTFELSANYQNSPISANPTLTVKDLIAWSYQISSAMEHLSNKKVIHGDLATRNVLLTAEKVAKITDFGLARQLYNYASYVKKNQEPLPWRWMAIESLRDLSFSTKSDVWSFGVTAWEIFSLAEVPFPGLVWNQDFVDSLNKGLRMRHPRYNYRKLYEDLLIPCWHSVPELRPSFEDASSFLKLYYNEAEGIRSNSPVDQRYVQPK